MQRLHQNKIDMDCKLYKQSLYKRHILRLLWNIIYFH